jgi:hypothetical protein
MDYELRIVVEKVAISSQEVIKRDTITSYAVQCPTSIGELGLRHTEQIALLRKVQDILLAEQALLLDSGIPVCPSCGNTLKKNGYKTSNFHAIFSDHTVRIQTYHCSHPDCRWHNTPTITAVPAEPLIIQVDGGHIPIQEKDKRSFEALAAIVYRPEQLQAVDRHHCQIMEKTCVISAVDDQLQTIKAYAINAAKKQGLSQETQVTALADGAQNCWSVVAAIQPECATLECILDWFHIAQKFQQAKNALGEAFALCLESAKWKLWHGHADDALTKLAVLRDNVSDEGHRSKLTGLYEYLHRNQVYLVNYDAREQANQTYTSQVAESHIDTLINARHKRTKKMQWTREGAHHVLQIRALMASNEWESKGHDVVLLALRAAA